MKRAEANRPSRPCPRFDVAILAGGAGTRLWPLSQGDRPKQFLRIPLGQTLLEQAVERARLLVPTDRIWIVTLARQVRETRRVLPRFNPKRILAEPQGRNSGPAAAYATMQIEGIRKAPTPVLILPADHFVGSPQKFRASMEKAIRRAAEGESLVTFGISISSPRTDFGYVEAEAGSGRKGVRKVKRFIEKPRLALAKKFARSGRHFWNSGIFAWRSDFFQKELSRKTPEIYRALSKVNWSRKVSRSHLESHYRRLPNISIDYALMEKSKDVDVVPTNFPWSDLGNWAAVYGASAKDGERNAVVGNGLVVEGSKNLIHSQGKKTVLFGVNDLIVIQTQDCVLVTTQSASGNLKELLSKL